MKPQRFFRRPARRVRQGGDAMPLENDDQLRQLILRFQKDELTDHHVYGILAKREKEPNNRAILERIANDEKEHVGIWQQYSGVEVAPERWRILLYSVLGFFLGYTFVIKIMENGEAKAIGDYQKLIDDVPEVKYILEHEKAHEAKLQNLLDEERLRYVGAMVLGLNDALVELTGTIAGLTLALRDTKIVALAGIITGVSATLSMAASNYLAERADEKPDALKSSIYTGVAYLITVVLLVMPYLLLPAERYVVVLIAMLVVVVLVIFFFNYYISVAKSLPFFQRFKEMAGISLGVAVISFAIGLIAKALLGVDV
jgi:VIT1/CCC1 family predicted Fe2+/Mn2+ transporter